MEEFGDERWHTLWRAAKASKRELYVDLMLAAEANAQDTVCLEKGANVDEYSEYNEIRFRSLMMLVSEEDELTHRWFWRRGLTA